MLAMGGGYVRNALFGKLAMTRSTLNSAREATSSRNGVTHAAVERPPAGIPVSAMVENIVGCKWSVRLLQLCAEGHRRPSEFLRECPGLSAKVMNERWRKMLRYGIVERAVYGQKPPLTVEYSLTPFGRRFLTILDEVRRLQEEVDSGTVPLVQPVSLPR